MNYNSSDLELIIKNLIFLNMIELKKICDNFNISYYIYIEKNNNIIKTNEIDHKEIIINNIKKYLKNKKTSTTIYKKSIINYENKNINENSFIYYGQYKTTNKKILELMKKLTNQKFKFGAISQKIIRKIWKKNKLITYKDFAYIWNNENEKGINFPELAYNNFMKINGNIDRWHQYKKNIILLFKHYNLL